MSVEITQASSFEKECWDVIVAGGGLGGIAAAIAAARTGAKTLLIERNTYPGGVATAGMCCSIFNCFYTSKKQPGSKGIPMEIADRLAISMGYGEKWHHHKGHIIYDLERGKLVLQNLLQESGVVTLFGTLVCGVKMDENTVEGIIIETKTGRQTINCRNIVDATGDADIAFFAGAPLHIPGQNKVENSRHSLCFRLGNVDVDSFIDYFRHNRQEYPEMMDVEWTLDEALRQYEDCGTFLFPHGGGMQMQAFRQAREDGKLPAEIGIYSNTDACQMHGIRKTGMVHVVTGFTDFNGLSPGNISTSIIDGRQMAFKLVEVYRRYIPGFKNAFVAGVADNLGIRSSRWLDGNFVFNREMMRPGNRFDDAVSTLVPYSEEVRHTGEKAWGVQVLGEDTFDLPYRCLLPSGIDGLIMGSGRSISATDPWLLRVMVHTMSIGQAAGTAAMLASKHNTSLRWVDTAEISSIQSELTSQ